MDGAVITTKAIISIRGSWPWRISVVAVLTVLADWLFFRQEVGISIVLFILAIGAGVVLANGIEASRREVLLYTGILVAALVPLVEDFNFMSALIATCGVATFSLGVMTGLRGELKEKVIAVGWHLLSGPFQFFRDLPLLRQWAQQRGTCLNLATLKGWIVPLAFGSIFVALFAAANPLIANYLTQWNVADEVKQLDLHRPLFWLGSVIVIWMFVNVGRRLAHPDGQEFVAAVASMIRCQLQIGFREPNWRLVWPPLVRPDGKELVAAATADLPSPSFSSLIFNDAALVRSLILFNLLFAMQSIMDIQYLWAGAALPDGMSYASYAHRGAYPLILTALLAAGFVVVAMRPGSDAERSPMMRTLVFLWVGQNVLLVVSSILRLDLYVAVYSLTYLRVAAFVWMLIVAAGLLLIVARIVTYRSNTWLVSANIAALALTVYACSFVNFPSLVANYNVEHARDMASADQKIDLQYIASLGPQAIPALDEYWESRGWRLRSDLATAHLKEAENWRAWTFRSWRLTRYLAATTR